MRLIRTHAERLELEASLVSKMSELKYPFLFLGSKMFIIFSPDQDKMTKEKVSHCLFEMV